MRILVVDPDEYYHTKLRESLADIGELTLCGSATTAVNIVARTQPDVLICELLFPDSTGYDLLEQLRNGSKKTRPAIFIFTKIENTEDRNRAMEMGANHFFIKGRDTLRHLKEVLLKKVYERV